MTRMIAALCLLAVATACTGPADTNPGMRHSSPLYDPEPTMPGIHVSGHAVVGVSTTN